MKKLKFLPIFLSLCAVLSLFAPLSALAEDAPAVASAAAIVVDRETGRILFSKNPEAKVYPASLTKIMTVLLAVEAVERGEAALADRVTAGGDITFDLSSLGSTAGIQVGETMSLEDLLYCAMLSSANEACNIIAEHIAGTIGDFVDRMNERASSLGCAGTHFANTHGLTDSGHYTTAADMARIALEASGHTLFMTLCGTAEKTVPATNLSGERSLHNSNALICAQSIYGGGFLYEGASGMKTGHTTPAGYCLASTAERDGTALLCLTFGADSSGGCFTDAARLLDWAFENYTPELVPKLDFLVSSGGPVIIDGPAVEDTDGPEIASAAAVVMNRDNGEIFYARNGSVRLSPADTAKVMTALLAVEAVESGQVTLRSEVTVSEDAFYDLTASATKALSAGENLTLEDLLYLTLLPSADDAANAVAEYVGGTVYAFVDQMNERAEKLGCTGTHFTNAHGLYDPNNYTTARDMALIALEVTRHDILTRLCATASVEIPETNLSPARPLNNTNALLNANSPYGGGYVYEAAGGLKTGYSSAAGYCLVSTAGNADSGIDLVAAVLGGVQNDGGYSSFTDTIALYDYVFGNFSYQEVLSPSVNIASVDVNLGKDVDYVNLRPAGAVTLLLPNDYDPEEFHLDLQVYSLQQGQIVTAPVTAGEVLGEVSVLRQDGQNCGTVKLVAAANVDLSRSQYIRTHVRETVETGTFRLIFWGVVLLLAVYLAWVAVYRIQRLRYRRALKASADAAPAPVPPETPAAEPETELPPAPDIEYFPDADIPAPSDALVGLTRFPDAETEEAPAKDSAEPSRKPIPDPSNPFADIEAAFDDKLDRDYFEEFFRQK